MTKPWPLSSITPDKTQVRKEFDEEKLEALAKSIEEKGLVTPILVSLPNNGKHTIIDGERRYRAYQILSQRNPENMNWQHIPANIVDKPDDLAGVLANLAKVEYNPIEYAEALNAIYATGKKHEELAALVGKSRSLITEYLSLLKLPDAVKAHAKSDSRVPFNFLKALAASKLSKEECITKYEAKFASCKSNDSQQSVSANQDKEARAAKRVERFQKKITTIKSTFDKFSAKIAMQVEDKELLAQTLDAIIQKAEALKSKLLLSEEN